MTYRSKTWSEHPELHHVVWHSPNGMDKIAECEECHKRWMFKPSGDVWELFHYPDTCPFCKEPKR